MLNHQDQSLTRIACEMARVGGWLLDVRAGRITWSAEACRIHGVPEGTSPAVQEALAFYTPPWRDIIESALDWCMREGTPFDHDLQLVTAAGRPLWVRMIGKAACDENGQIAFLQGALQDIDDKIKADNDRVTSVARLRELCDALPQIVWMARRDGTVDYVNRSADAYTGVAVSAAPDRWLDILHAEDVPEALAAWSECVRTGAVYSTQFRIRAQDGAYRWHMTSATPIRDREGNIIKWYGTAIDVHDRRQAEHQIRLAAIGFANMAEGLVVVDPQARIVSVNPAFTRMTGYTLDEVAGHTPRALLHDPTGRHDDAFFRQIAEAANTRDLWEGEIWCRRKDGEVFPQLLSLATVRDADGDIVNHVAVFNDITKQKEHEARLQQIAHHDPLTRLPNRLLLLDRLERALAAQKRSGRDGALLFIDLDNFKTLNDRLGHHNGDILLQQLAARLGGCIRESDTAARLGGDEFIVMIECLSSDRQEAMEQVKAVSEKIAAAITCPYRIGEHEWPLTVSIGVTLFSDGENADSALLKRADLAMYQAKADGRNAVRFFDSQMQAAVRARATLQEELRQGVERQEFLLHYQPQVDRDGRIVGAEALLRWPRPGREGISPAEFIPLAEQTKLILPLGRWVLESGCAQLVAWSARPETAHLALAINVSACQFHDPGFEKLVLDVLDRIGADPGKLKLELTESLLVDDLENTASKIRRLKATGIRFSLDDFGTGYSSLSYLRGLPLDQLKIDRSFVRDILVDSNNASICQMIISLAQNLGLEVIAEGVELPAQRDFLGRLGCNAYQGYLFGRPVAVGEFDTLVRQASIQASVADDAMPMKAEHVLDNFHLSHADQD